jgi:hypothetical protein
MSSPRILAFTGLRSPAIKPLTCNYLVADAGMPAMDGLGRFLRLAHLRGKR